MEQGSEPESGGVQITITNRTDTPVTVTGSIMSHAAPAETRREMCEREVQEWDWTAANITAIGDMARATATSEARDCIAKEIPRAVVLCRANAEEWRARARRCAR